MHNKCNAKFFHYAFFSKTLLAIAHELIHQSTLKHRRISNQLLDSNKIPFVLPKRNGDHGYTKHKLVFDKQNIYQFYHV